MATTKKTSPTKAGTKSTKPVEAILMIADTERDSNMLYATRFFAPDPFIFFSLRGRKYVVMSDLEIDRAKKQSSADVILPLSRYVEKLAQSKSKYGGYGAIVDLIFKEKKIRKILVPANFPLQYADQLRDMKYKVRVKPDPFYDERVMKSPDEIKKITASLRVAEEGVRTAEAVLRESRIRKGYLWLGGEKLTSERLREHINAVLIAKGCVPSHTIVAGGENAVDPHNEGYGPLQAHKPIICDIFPRSDKTGYWGDLTRTFVRGKATEQVKKAYHLIWEGQNLAFRRLKDGADGQKIHAAITDMFTENGFPTGKKNGRMTGYFHGTGHGVGLDIHESPSISTRAHTLRAGHVVTVEPGLYYPGMGGIRLEDIVLVTKTGVRNLTKVHKVLEL